MIYRLFFTLLPPVIMAGCEILALAAVETAVVGVGTVIESQIDSEVYLSLIHISEPTRLC
mgnify:CR=1 FL=1